jgi:protein-L-isoaspartate(D-aspartate) O-methyltransferase
MTAGAAAPLAGDDDLQAGRRRRMIERDLVPRGIRDPEVLRAMGKVPRQTYVLPALSAQAYDDNPLPIGEDQTISQPYIVALMTELAHIGPADRVLEVGTGSGYQAAVLAEIARDVYTIEIIEPLATRASAALRAAGYTNVHTRTGDGYRGWPEAAPFDAILVTAAPAEVPPPLLAQLAPGGRLVVPEGTSNQELVVYERGEKGIERRRALAVRFVPMTGEALSPRP